MKTQTENKDVTVYINDTFCRIQKETFMDAFFLFEKSTAEKYKVSTDFNTYRCIHRMDECFSIRFNYQKMDYINFYLN